MVTPTIKRSESVSFYPRPPSEWYKSLAEFDCYPLSIEVDPVSNSTTNMNSASARASHDSQAPSVQPQKLGPVDSRGEGSTVLSMTLKGQQFSIPTSQDSVVRMRPDDTLIIRDSVNGCDSVGPSIESHCHALLPQSFDSEEHASRVSMFRNSAAYENSSSSLRAEGNDAATLNVAPQVHSTQQVCPLKIVHGRVHHLASVYQEVWRPASVY
uniref:Uncharacterized protein n=1 Tax=Oryza brachyantha TaxID=4533 RepID=J3MCX6_ORYBR